MTRRAPSVVVLAAALAAAAVVCWAVVASLDGFETSVRRASHGAVHRGAQRLALDANARAVARGTSVPTTSAELSAAGRHLGEVRGPRMRLSPAPDGSRVELRVGPSRACVRLAGGRAVATDGPC